MKSISNRRAVLRATAVALVATATVAVGATPANAVTIHECHLNHTVDELTRFGDVTKNNVIVYAGSAEDSSHFEGVVRRGHEIYPACHEGEDSSKTFYWVVFRGKGTFVRKGDGGYRNWAFFGVFDRVSDKKVVFHAR
ncbi:hypothetical protein [Micromonospora sp. NPDC005220]|uniref:hypothetical protein n=1 Tax=Micromonospora sp. NPDC005220 TaxID=3155589 RepID=UPI0033BCB9DD